MIKFIFIIAIFFLFYITEAKECEFGFEFCHCEDNSLEYKSFCKTDYLDKYFSLGLDGSISIYLKKILKNRCCIISSNSYLYYKSYNNRVKKYDLLGSVLGIEAFYLDDYTLIMIRGIGGARLNYIQFFIVKNNNISKVKNGLFATNEKEPILIVDGDNIKIKMQYFNKISKKWISKFYYYNSKKEKFLQNAKGE